MSETKLAEHLSWRRHNRDLRERLALPGETPTRKQSVMVVVMAAAVIALLLWAAL